MKKVCIFGGDTRQRFLAGIFRKNGFETAVWNVPGLENSHSDMEAALRDAEVCVLPFPMKKDEKNLADAESIARTCGKNCAVFVAGDFLPTGFDLLKDEKFLQENAEITAEGAISLLMQESDRAIMDSRVLIVGFGRIGKALCRRLTALGADVFASARKTHDLSRIQAIGCHALITGQYGDLGKFDFVLNTVPAAVFSEAQIAQIECPYLELASFPYGIAADKSRPAQYIAGGGLPGKYAPRSAAQAIYAAIMRQISC